MPTRRQLIQKIELNSNQSSVTFSGIPQNYTDLKIVCSVRGTYAAIATDLMITLNGSTSNFSSKFLYGNGASAASTGLARAVGTLVGSTATASTFASNQIYIPNYTSSSYKSISSRGASENNATTAYTLVFSSLWSDTSAINSISFSPNGGGNFVAGSTFYLYGITHVPIIRGGEEYVSGGFKYHKFTSTAALQVIEPGDVEALVVAGGGGGGYSRAGGGGAGGMKISSISLSPQFYSVTVGAGGAGSSSNVNGSTGSNSMLSTITSSGGGGGGIAQNAGLGTAGSNGGSGGGGAATASGGSGTFSQGSNGGAGSSTSYGPGGGGGGKGGVGSAGTGNDSTGVGGAGGIGSIYAGSTYAGGGGGGGPTGGAGGSGIGGAGGNASVPGGTGVENTGSGGGGGGVSAGTLSGGSGGKGIVIIRYPYDGN